MLVNILTQDIQADIYTNLNKQKYDISRLQDYKEKNMNKIYVNKTQPKMKKERQEE